MILSKNIGLKSFYHVASSQNRVNKHQGVLKFVLIPPGLFTRSLGLERPKTKSVFFGNTFFI